MRLSTIPAARKASHRRFLTLPCLAILVTGLGGLAAPPASAQAATRPPLAAWSGPVSLEKAPFQNVTNLQAIACPTANLCVASDASSNVVTSADPADGAATWSAPAPARNELSQISCPTASFCAGVGEAGIDTSTAPTSRSGWRISYPHSDIPAANSISCPSAKLCVVASQGSVYFSTDPTATKASWHPTVFGEYPDLPSVSCPTRSFCAAVATNGHLFTSTRPAGGKSDWKTADIDGTVQLFDVTCPSDTFCLALDELGRILYSTDPTGGASAWHRTSEPGTLAYVTCESASLCLAASGTGVVSSADPTAGASAWRASNPFGGEGPSQLSCVRAFCATIWEGNVATTTDANSPVPAWVAADGIDGSTDVTVDCASVSFCAAADGLGRVLVSTDPTGGPSGWLATDIDGSSFLLSISCPSASFCAATDGTNVLTSTDPGAGASAWHRTHVAPAIEQVTCPSSALCLATQDNNGAVWLSADPASSSPTWVQVDLPGAEYGPSPLDCPSAKLCFAVVNDPDTWPTLYASADPTGGAATWKPTAFKTLGEISALSCPSASQCVAAGYAQGSDGLLGNPQNLTSANPTGGVAAWNVSNGPAGLLDCPNTGTCYMFDAYTTDSGVSDTMLTTTDPSAAAPAWHATPAPGSLLNVSCPAVSLCVGSYNALYGGGIQYGVSGLAPTTTSLALSAARISHGRENRERLTVTVGALFGVPSGKVVIAAGKTTVCTLALHSGEASCTLRASQLRAGTYHLQASYQASSPFASSQSATVRLVVAA